MRQAEDYKTIDYTERVLSRCKTEGDCEIWQGAKHRQGYGMLRYKGEMQTTHRVIGLEKYGDPGDSGTYKFTQTCGNLLCCNPDHIELTTHSDIMTKTVETRKPKSCRTKQLTKENVIEIRNRVMPRKWGTNQILGEEYGVSPNIICNIRRGATYKWIQ